MHFQETTKNCKSKGRNFKMENVVNSEIKLGIPFMIPDHVYKF